MAAAVPVYVMRTSVAADLARGPYRLPHLPSLAVVAFTIVIELTRVPGQREAFHPVSTFFPLGVGGN